MKTWLLTGGTGFLGHEILQRLSAQGDRVFALVRPETLARLKDSPQLAGVEWIAGDIAQPNVVADIDDRTRVLAETTGVVHLAALYNLAASRKDMYLSNVVGTNHVLHLSESMPKLEAFHYASTIAVAGNYSGVLYEDMYDVGQTFPDGYAQTKFAAEGSVRAWVTKVPVVIHRLGVLVGHSETGHMPKVDGPYYLLRLLNRIAKARGLVNTLKILPLPFNERTRLYMVPVDVTANAVTALMNVAHAPGVHTYHLTGDPLGAPIRSVLREMLNACGYRVMVVPLPSNRWIAQLASAVDVPAETLFYMNCGWRFDNQRFAQRLPEFQIPFFETYAPKLLAYAIRNLMKGGRE